MIINVWQSQTGSILLLSKIQSVLNCCQLSQCWEKGWCTGFTHQYEVLSSTTQWTDSMWGGLAPSLAFHRTFPTGLHAEGKPR